MLLQTIVTQLNALNDYEYIILKIIIYKVDIRSFVEYGNIRSK